MQFTCSPEDVGRTVAMIFLDSPDFMESNTQTSSLPLMRAAGELSMNCSPLGRVSLTTTSAIFCFASTML